MMPLLAGLLSNLFVGMSGFLAAYVGARAALAIAGIAVIAGMTVAVAALLQGLVTGVLLAFPSLDPAVLSILWMAIPDNASLCAGACLSADAFCAAYRWGGTNVQMALKL